MGTRKSEVPDRILAELKRAGGKGRTAEALADELNITIQYARIHLRRLKDAGTVVSFGKASPVTAPVYKLAKFKK